jgi:hypothetical protein
VRDGYRISLAFISLTKAFAGTEPLSMCSTASLKRSLNAISSARNAAASAEFRQFRSKALIPGVFAIPDAMSHLSSA